MWSEVISDWFVEEHVDALGDEIEFFCEVDAGTIHDFDADFVDEGSEFFEKREAFGQRIFIVECGCYEVDKPFVD